MKSINAEHDRVFDRLKAEHNASADEYHQTTETASEFRDIIAQLLRIPGINVELCGCWLWISGDTHTVKDALKSAGCRWSPNKSMWYWRHPEDGQAYASTEDGGTCNFDSPTINYRAMHMSKARAVEAIEAAGLRCFDWRCYGPPVLVICGIGLGQGNRNTRMAEAANETLDFWGIPSGMYYQMD